MPALSGVLNVNTDHNLPSKLARGNFDARGGEGRESNPAEPISEIEVGVEFSSAEPVHLLIIHPETVIGGAEKMLGYFLPALSERSFRVTVAVADGPLKELVAGVAEILIIPNHTKFSVLNLFRQIRKLHHQHRALPFDVVHGWAARDWELTSIVGRIFGRPALGTLHDHPAAHYIRHRRRFLMRLTANWGLQRVVCVSDAVRNACEEAGYQTNRLLTIRNGLPTVKTESAGLTSPSPFRLGYLGGLSPNKGIEDLLAIMDHLAVHTSATWELRLAGAPITKNDEAWLQQLKKRYAQRPWWSGVVWLGWVNCPLDFLKSIDLLVFTSSSFDSLPTVLIEAACVGTPVLASAVGGAPEIVEHALTGWLFAPGDCGAASATLSRLLDNPGLLTQAGTAAKVHVPRKFRVEKMVEAYEDLYLTLRRNG